MQAGYECLNADVVDGCIVRPQTSSCSVSLDLPASSSPPDLQDILYTNTPRLLSGPSYSAKSASPTLSAGHSPRALEVAPAAHLNSCAMQDSFNCQPSTQIVWEAEAGGREQKPANSVADGNHSGAAVATLISPGESDLQSRVCQLEHELQQVSSQRNNELQELQDMMDSLQQKEQELTRIVESQAAAQQQEDELKQAQSQIVQLQHELECSSVKDEEEHQQTQARLYEMEQAVKEREQQIAKLQQSHAEAAEAVLEMKRETSAARAALMQALQADDSKPQLVLLQGEASEDKSLPDLAANFVGAHTTLQARYLEEAAQRRALHNQLVDLKGAIRVFCRVRPLLARERAAKLEAATNCNLLNNTITVTATRTGRAGSAAAKAKSNSYSYDAVYEPGSSQEAVFADVEPVVTSVMDGYNVCIFAYGQTGSGKTYTMEGPPGDRGVNYRTLQQLFQTVEARRDETSFLISVSLLEVYMDSMNDLLWEEQMGARPKLEVRIGAHGSHLPSLVEKQVSSVEEAWKTLEVGVQSRHSAETKMNERSSRSHCLLCVKVRGQSKFTGDVWRSKLWLVDLAGSERVGKTDAQGERLREAQYINKSLSALGDCIHALAAHSSHVPFRNSKLTYVLQDSLSGDSKTLMLVNVNPTEADAGETACSLGFASRVRGVELGPAKRHIEAGAEVQELRGQLDALRHQMRAVEDDRNRVADKLNATEAAGYSFMADKLAHLEAQLATKDWQLQTERAGASRLENKHPAEAPLSNRGVDRASPMAMPPPPTAHWSQAVPRTVCKALSLAGFTGNSRPVASAQSKLDTDDSAASLASSRSGLGRPTGLPHTASKHRALSANGAGAGCSTPPSASKKGSWGMTSTGRSSPGPTPKLQGLEGGIGSRGTAARVGPSPAFKRSLPAAAFSTPLKTASLRTNMAAFSGVANSSSSSSSLRASVPAFAAQPSSQVGAVKGDTSIAFSRASSRVTPTSNSTDATTSFGSPSVGASVTEYMARQHIQLSNQPILGLAATQVGGGGVVDVWHTDGGEPAASACGVSGEDTDRSACQATDRSSVCESVAASAAAEALLADTHRSTGSAIQNAMYADREGPRAVSPPFFFEADASQESLVDLGTESDPTPAAFRCGKDIHDGVVSGVAAVTSKAAAASDNQQAAQSHGAVLASQASQTCAAQAGALECLTEAKVSGAEPLTSSLRMPMTVLPRQAVAQSTLNGADRPVYAAQSVAAQTQAAASGADVAESGPTGKAMTGGSKENEPGVMARAVRGPREGHCRLGGQAAAKPPKPVTSSKAEYMAKFEQYRKARAEAKPVSACGSGQQLSRLTLGAGAARVKAPVKDSGVNLKPERTPLRSSSLQK